VAADPDDAVEAEGLPSAGCASDEPVEVPPVEQAARSTVAAATPATRLQIVLIQEV
jgi:hypothetical protein